MLDPPFAGYENDAGVASRLLGRMVMPLFQPQDTSNRRAEMFIKMVDALNVPLDQFPAALERAGGISEGSDEAILPTVYNPVGDVILRISNPAYAPYGARVNDLEGIRRAAVLTTELRSRRVPGDRVPVELEASTVRVPYTGEPLGWDAEEGAIVFTGLEPEERGRHAFKY